MPSGKNGFVENRKNDWKKQLYCKVYLRLAVKKRGKDSFQGGVNRFFYRSWRNYLFPTQKGRLFCDLKLESLLSHSIKHMAPYPPMHLIKTSNMVSAARFLYIYFIPSSHSSIFTHPSFAWSNELLPDLLYIAYFFYLSQIAFSAHLYTHSTLSGSLAEVCA